MRAARLKLTARKRGKWELRRTAQGVATVARAFRLTVFDARFVTSFQGLAYPGGHIGPAIRQGFGVLFEGFAKLLTEISIVIVPASTN